MIPYKCSILVRLHDEFTRTMNHICTDKACKEIESEYRSTSMSVVLKIQRENLSFSLSIYIYMQAC